ncbi:dTDP-glucose 4,6-dehydratase [Planococcus beigongshangi]|uniref:dTDP-glucose 4,6-dehydratase n=1 Tax=Planococcus beigongshangi TaxID=2782536 RepID=UPI00193BA45F|nr:dTDP-glucose 4,6-dehydratase [Planococcus beigongshangi]
MKKILITGGAGFIGGNFIHYMADKYPEYDLVNLDLLTYAGDVSKHEKLGKNSNYTFYQMDIADRASVFQLFNESAFDYVVHFAAESHVDRSIIDPSVFIRTNVLGTQVLLDAARESGIEKFLHVSTDEVYGELDFETDNLFTEDMPLNPNSPYSASKAASDLLVRAYHETYGMPVNITRCSNNYGPYHFPEKLIPLAISNALNNQAIPVYGRGNNVRDWLHVQDHCSAIDLLLHKGEAGEVYNIGGHNERTNLEVVQTIIKALDKEDSLIEFVADRPGHDKRYAINPSKLEKMGWKPNFDFDTGINETIRWYQDNRKWWERLNNDEQLAQKTLSVTK